MKIILICALYLIVGDSVCHCKGDKTMKTLTTALKAYALKSSKTEKYGAVTEAIDKISVEISASFSKPKKIKSVYERLTILFNLMNSTPASNSQPIDAFLKMDSSKKAFVFIYIYGAILPIISSEKLHSSEHPSNDSPQYVKDFAQAMHTYKTKNFCSDIKACLKELPNVCSLWLEANIKFILYLFELVDLPEINEEMSKEKAILIGASIKVLDTLMATEKEKLLVVWPQVNVIFDKYSVSDLQQMIEDDYRKVCLAALTLAHYINNSKSESFHKILGNLIELIARSGDKVKRDATFAIRYRLSKEMPGGISLDKFKPTDPIDDAKNLDNMRLINAIYPPPSEHNDVNPEDVLSSAKPLESIAPTKE